MKGNLLSVFWKVYLLLKRIGEKMLPFSDLFIQLCKVMAGASAAIL